MDVSACPMNCAMHMRDDEMVVTIVLGCADKSEVAFQ